MKTCWLLRHAKACAGRDDESDHERALEARGRDAAERTGRHLADRGVVFDVALCSSAVRARETLEHLLLGLGAASVTIHDHDLYLASPGEIAARIQAVPASVASLLVVGHNPGIGVLAARLAQTGDSALRSAVHVKFPTCALAELRFDASDWHDLTLGCELASYVTPKGLER
jgi:phosphohistidine phosphatase